MKTFITVQLRPDVGGHPNADAPELRALLKQQHATWSAAHPGVEDEELSRFFIAEAPDAERAATLAEALQRLPAVEAAYVKPTESLP